MSKRTEPIKFERFILAEGFEDAAFIRALIKTRHLGDFDVSPVNDIGDKGGNSGFESAVSELEPFTGFTGVNHVIVLSDNDDKPNESFKFVADQIESAKNNGDIQRDWGIAPHAAQKADGDPAVSIWMWPEADKEGCLETLLWQVIVAKHAVVAKCVDDALSCCGADQWPIGKLDKARVRCFLSLFCKRNPAVTLATLWRDFPGLIPLNHSAFNKIAAFIKAA